jgi:hypothetical protein
MFLLQRVVDAIARNNNQVTAATDNHESGHVHFFTRRQLRRLFADCSLSVARRRRKFSCRATYRAHVGTVKTHY